MSKNLKIIPAHGDIVVCPFCGQELLSDYDQRSHWNSLYSSDNACRGETSAKRVVRLHTDREQWIHVIRDGDGDLWEVFQYPEYEDSSTLERPEPLTLEQGVNYLKQVGQFHDEQLEEIRRDQDQVRLFSRILDEWR